MSLLEKIMNNDNQPQLRLLFFFLFTLFINSWIWHFFSLKSYLIFAVMIFLSIGLLILSNLKTKLKYLVLFFPLFWFLTVQKISKTVFSLQELELFTINSRRSYYVNPKLGRMMENKATFFIGKLSRNLFESLDVNYYFFATHPRERSGMIEIKKFPSAFLPFLLLGIYYQLKKKKLLGLFFALSVIFSVSFLQRIDYGSYLFFPSLILSITYGLNYFSYLGCTKE